MLNVATELTKSQKRQLRKEGVTIKSGMKLQNIKPLTDNQQRAFDAWENNRDLFMHGCAGTGKTLMAFYFALREIMLDNADRVIVVRSVVPSRDMGFLPGSIGEKTQVFEAPYYEICNILYGRGDAYGILKDKKSVTFTTTSYLRGLTFDNAIVIVDECQNLAWHELNTIMGRIGTDTRIIFAGDTKQSDLDERHGKYDLYKMIDVITKMTTFEFIQMLPADVVRSGKAKEYILACEKLGY